MSLFKTKSYKKNFVFLKQTSNENNCRTRLMRGKGHLKALLSPIVKDASKYN